MKTLRAATSRLARRSPADSSFIGDVEHLAEVACDTVHRLDARGLHDLSRPLVAAIERLGRKRR